MELDRETFDLLIRFSTLKGSGFENLPPPIMDLLLIKFDCKSDTFENIFPFTFE